VGARRRSTIVRWCATSIVEASSSHGKSQEAQQLRIPRPKVRPVLAQIDIPEAVGVRGPRIFMRCRLVAFRCLPFRVPRRLRIEGTQCRAVRAAGGRTPPRRRDDADSRISRSLVRANVISTALRACHSVCVGGDAQARDVGPLIDQRRSRRGTVVFRTFEAGRYHSARKEFVASVSGVCELCWCTY
jgi:hypothetical protein